MQVVTSDEYRRKFQRRVVLSETGQPEIPEEWDYELLNDVPDEYLDDEALAAKQAQVYETSPSEFTEFSVTVPNKETQKRVPFSFAQRKYLLLPYDTPTKRLLFKCGRQVEKSTLLGNKCLAYCCINASFQVLYVSPTNLQTKTFSQDRLKEPVETSDRLKAWTTTKLSDNVFLKKFINRSQITLRYAYHNADRVRGIPADMILLDEIQDIITDNIPVIEECASHSPFKIFIYSGTPKSLDNPLEKYWTEQSTQNEWVVPCERHGTPGSPSSWFWNILDETNIGEHGLMCSKCKQLISPIHPHAQWVSMNPDVKNKLAQPFEGYRIPQLMVPWIQWHEILDKQKRMSCVKFYNEVLGLSYDSGTRPLTRQDIIDNCKPGLFMDQEGLNRVHAGLGGACPVFCGIDWGTGENTYTVLSLGTYIDERFTIFYIHRFEGPESEPEVQIDLIEAIIKRWDVRLVGVDYGGGHWPNDALQRKFGRERIWKYQYSTPGVKVKWEPKMNRFIVHRTEVMSDIFNAIKRRTVFRFLDFSQFFDPYGQDCLNIFSEYNEQARQIQYKKSPDCTDDSFHSMLYCFLVSMMKIPRPDVLNPLDKTKSSEALPITEI
jgi:hypothetical protein